MLRLYVMRHAKSSWAAPGARDFDRELNERGHFDTAKVSQILKSRQYIPAQILCSPAVRTKETLEDLRHILPNDIDIKYPNSLYSSGLSDYIELIQDVESMESLLIIGHNPMCGALATALPRPDSDHSMETIAYKYPTATLAVIEFDIENWSEIKKGNGNLIDCLIPSEL